VAVDDKGREERHNGTLLMALCMCLCMYVCVHAILYGPGVLKEFCGVTQFYLLLYYTVSTELCKLR